MTSRLRGTSSTTRTLDQRDLASLRPAKENAPRQRGAAAPMVAIDSRLFCVRCNVEVDDDLTGIRHVNSCLWKALIEVAGTAEGARELAKGMRSPSLESLPEVISSFVIWRRSLSDEECRDAQAVRWRLRRNGYEVPEEITQKCREYSRRLNDPDFRRLTPEERHGSMADAAALGRRAKLERSALRAQSIPVPEELREMRLSSGLSQAELARKVGCSSHCVSNWERGKTVPSRSQIDAYIGVLQKVKDLAVPVGDRLRLRLQRGLRQIDVSRFVGVTDRTVGNWENGKCNPDTEELICRYAEALGWKP